MYILMYTHNTSHALFVVRDLSAIEAAEVSEEEPIFNIYLYTYTYIHIHIDRTHTEPALL